MSASRPLRAQDGAMVLAASPPAWRLARVSTGGFALLVSGVALALACGGGGGGDGQVAAESPSDPPSGPRSEEPALPMPETLVKSRDGRLGVRLPRDLLAQPFDATVMATSADGSFRLHVEARPGELLATLGPLKDELIALGWEVEAEKHFQAAIHLQLGMGVGRNRVARHLWLVERRPAAPGPAGPIGTPAPAGTAQPASSPPASEPVSVLCEGHGRGGGTARLGAQLRAICQTVEVRGP